MARRQHAVGVAIAAVAREPHRRLDLLEGLAVGVVHQQRAGGEQHGVGERCASAHAQVARRRPALDSCAAPPSPLKRSPMKGWFIMPNTGSPKRVSAISVPQAGMPDMKDLVPSIGSSTQTYSASGRSLAEFLADHAVGREGAPDQRAHGGLGGMVGGGDRVELALALVGDAQRGAEERQDGLARDEASSSTKAEKSIAVMVLPYCDASPPDLACAPTKATIGAVPIAATVCFQSIISHW